MHHFHIVQANLSHRLFFKMTSKLEGTSALQSASLAVHICHTRASSLDKILFVQTILVFVVALSELCKSEDASDYVSFFAGGNVSEF